MNLPNVKVNVQVPDLPCVLDPEGRDAGRAQFRNTTGEDHRLAGKMKRRLQQRDWRLLRGELLNLNFSEIGQVTTWLNAVGYVPESRLNWILPARFAAKDVTPQILRSLQSLRDAIEIAMGLSESDFKRGVRKVHAYDEETHETMGVAGTGALGDTKKGELKTGEPYAAGPTLAHPARKFMSDPRKYLEDAGAPGELIERVIVEERESEVAWQLDQIFRGAGSAGVLASFAWDQSGIAVVTIHIANPIDAILLWVQIDRNFSKCTMVCCPCGQWFNRQRGNDRFHSPKCRNLFTQRERRTKITPLLEGLQAWRTLAAAKRRGRDRWEWITAWAIHKGREIDPTFTIEPGWAKKQKELRKAGS